MPTLLWDASGLCKRYVSETGTQTVNTLFTLVPTTQMVLPLMGYAEVYSILLRRRNDTRLDTAMFTLAVLALENETLNSPDFGFLSLEDADALNCLSLMERHNLNSSDAFQLAGFLRYKNALPSGSPSCLLVAADQRLLRAAQAEGLATLNPEQITPADVPQILSAL